MKFRVELDDVDHVTEHSLSRVTSYVDAVGSTLDVLMAPRDSINDEINGRLKQDPPIRATERAQVVIATKPAVRLDADDLTVVIDRLIEYRDAMRTMDAASGWKAE